MLNAVSAVFNLFTAVYVLVGRHTCKYNGRCYKDTLTSIHCFVNVFMVDIIAAECLRYAITKRSTFLCAVVKA